jgi:hypothetical protein
MKNAKDLSSDILATTMLIQSEHPELSKYLEEMPVTIPVDKDPAISNSDLLEYNESLKLLLNKYDRVH